MITSTYRCRAAHLTRQEVNLALSLVCVAFVCEHFGWDDRYGTTGRDSRYANWQRPPKRVDGGIDGARHEAPVVVAGHHLGAVRYAAWSVQTKNQRTG